MGIKSFKLILFGLGVVVWAVVHALRIRAAKQRMARIAAGNQCLNCDGVDVTRQADGMRCNACGYVASNALLETNVSERDIAAVTTPGAPSRRDW
ncbi:MAG: hypothetical protein H6726_20450 [Sandaracinaceae bacterium]|nr:hypothetical protein [Sandaracinaceae bacterium]